MQYRFDEKVDQTIQKSVRGALRLFKERGRAARESGIAQDPPTLEEFTRVAHELMESSMRTDLDRLRSPDLRDLFERTWSQKLRNYSTQRKLKEAHKALIRRF